MSIVTVIKKYLRQGEPPREYDPTYFSSMVGEVNDFAFRQEQPVSVGWKTGTYTTRRVIPDAATVTLEELADVLSTLVDDMKSSTKLGG